MIVRDLKVTDLQTVIEYGIRRKDLTVYKGLEASKAAVALAFRRAISVKSEHCFVAEEDGVIRGFILMMAMPYWWADPRTGPRYATDLAFFSTVTGGGSALLKAAIEWAKKQPRVAEVTFQHSSGLHKEMIRQVYLDAGCEEMGMSFWIDFRKESGDE